MSSSQNIPSDPTDGSADVSQQRLLREVVGISPVARAAGAGEISRAKEGAKGDATTVGVMENATACSN